MNKTYDDKSAAAYNAFADKQKEADKTLAADRVAAQDKFTAALTDITARRDTDLFELEKDHAQRVVELEKDYAQRLVDIVQQSMDRLRSVFQQAAQFDMSASFKIASDGVQHVMSMTTGAIQVSVDRWGSVMGSGIDALLANMKAKLAATKQLAANAAALSGAGFSQTFIEQVVSAGTDTGNSMAEAILLGQSRDAGPTQVAIQRS